MRVLLAAFTSIVAFAGDGAMVTFNRDVVPILKKHCQSCHRPGQIAPISFLTYEETRPWAKAIRAAVVSKKMPPWFADDLYGHFANDPSLNQSEIRTLAEWAESGAPEGDLPEGHPALPPPMQPTDGAWQIPPDHVVSLPAYRVPAKETVEWTYFTVPSGFAKDQWVTSIEILPSDPSVVHHAAIFIQPHRASVRYGEPITDDPVGGASSIQAVYVPGCNAMDYRRYGAAKFIRAQSDLVVQMHYTPKGQEVTEAIRIGFTVANERPHRRFVTYSPQPPAILNREIFRIPAGDPNWESPAVEGKFNVDAELVWFMPHMHLRGKDMTYAVTYPDGSSETLLRVARYNPAWQLGYDVASPIKVPKGAKLHVSAHYDNSANNHLNPDPSKDVYGGTQDWEEMMVPFFGVVVDSGADPRKVMTLPGQIGPGGG